MKHALTLAELEKELGPPEDFTLSQSKLPYLRQWALAIGIAPVEVHAMTNVALSNLYHERGNDAKHDATELQRLASDIFLKLMQTIQLAKIEPELIRQVVLREIEKLPNRKVEIVHYGQPSIILDGPCHYMTETIIRICSVNHPIMMVGPAGCGKTTIGKDASKALNLPFYITSAVNDEHHLNGFVDGYGRYHDKAFSNAFRNGGIWVADEIDAWDASAFLAANSALANGYATFPDNPYPVYRHPNFRMIATANTFGRGADRIYIGRNELDAATLDRFAVVPVDYDLNLERMFSNGNTEWLEYVWQIRKQVNERKIRHVVSSRAIIMGAIGLQIGFSRSEVEEFYLFKGMSKSDREKLTDDDE